MNRESSYLPLNSRSSPRGNGEPSGARSIERQFSNLCIMANPYTEVIPYGRRSLSGYSWQGDIESTDEEEDRDEDNEDDEEDEGDDDIWEEPEEPIFNKRLQHALKSGISVSGDIADALDDLKDTSPTLSQLWEDATALRDYESPTTHIVGVVGGSGAGNYTHSL
jgi:hypothetical protein